MASLFTALSQVTFIGTADADQSTASTILGELRVASDGSMYLVANEVGFISRTIDAWDVFYRPAVDDENWKRHLEKNGSYFSLNLTRTRPRLAEDFNMQSGPVRALKTVDSQIVLEAHSCADIAATSVALVSISKSGKSKGTEELNCQCDRQSSSAICRANVTAYVDDFMRENLGVFRDRANCFNAALIVAGAMSQVREVNDLEFMETLERKRCLQVTGRQIPGDIAVIFAKNFYGRQHVPIHAAVVISEDLFFEKPDIGAGVPYGLVSSQKVLDKYSVRSSSIKQYLKTYRCPKSFE